MPLHHGIHSRANRHHQSMVHCQLCLVRPWTTMVVRGRPLVIGDEAFMQILMRFLPRPSRRLTNKEEQLSTTPLDNQGGT